MTTHIAGHEGVGIVVAGVISSSYSDSIVHMSNKWGAVVGSGVSDDLLHSRVGVSYVYRPPTSETLNGID